MTRTNREGTDIAATRSCFTLHATFQQSIEKGTVASALNFALVAEPLVPAMASAAHSFWKDDEVVVDRDGIPHYTGARPELMKEYRKRVLFAFGSLEGDGDTEEKEQRDLMRKRKGFAKKLLNGLHGEAWRCCQDLDHRHGQIVRGTGLQPCKQSRR